MQQRIFIYGVTGSGKTTLAGELARRTGLPWHSVDDLAWEPGWVMIPAEEQRAKTAAICAGERWILDAAYGKWLDIPMARAELIVALDYPRWLSLGRLLKRTARRIVTREKACNGNTELLRNVVNSNSIIAWHFTSFQRNRKRIRQWEKDPSCPDVTRFQRPGDVRSWLDTLGTCPPL